MTCENARRERVGMHYAYLVDIKMMDLISCLPNSTWPSVMSKASTIDPASLPTAIYSQFIVKVVPESILPVVTPGQFCISFQAFGPSETGSASWKKTPYDTVVPAVSFSWSHFSSHGANLSVERGPVQTMQWAHFQDGYFYRRHHPAMSKPKCSSNFLTAASPPD